MHALFKNGVNLAISNKSGTIPVEKEVLNIISRGADICLVAFKIATSMLWGPVDLLAFSPMISFSILTVFVGNRKKLPWDGAVRYWRGDLFTQGIFSVQLFPILAKKFLKASFTDLGSFDSTS